MTIINKTITISEGNKKIAFDLVDLLEGDYEVRLIITPVDKAPRTIDFSSWSYCSELPSNLLVNRDEIYGEKES